MYIEPPQDEFDELLVKYTWFEENHTNGNHYDFRGLNTEKFLNLNEVEYNVAVEHKLYKETRITDYIAQIKDSEFYLSFSGKDYKVLSIKIDNETNTAKMYLRYTNIHGVVFPSTFLGYIGYFNKSIFKLK